MKHYSQYHRSSHDYEQAWQAEQDRLCAEDKADMKSKGEPYVPPVDVDDVDDKQVGAK